MAIGGDDGLRRGGHGFEGGGETGNGGASVQCLGGDGGVRVSLCEPRICARRASSCSSLSDDAAARELPPPEVDAEVDADGDAEDGVHARGGGNEARGGAAGCAGASGTGGGEIGGGAAGRGLSGGARGAHSGQRMHCGAAQLARWSRSDHASQKAAHSSSTSTWLASPIDSLLEAVSPALGDFT